MTDVVRQCEAQIVKVVEYWIEEGDLTYPELSYILQQVDEMFAPEEEVEEEEEDEDDEEGDGWKKSKA